MGRTPPVVAELPAKAWPMILADGDGNVSVPPGRPVQVLLRPPARPPKSGALTPRTSPRLAQAGLLVTACAYAEPDTPASPLGLFLAILANVGPDPITLAQGAVLGQATA